MKKSTPLQSKLTKIPREIVAIDDYERLAPAFIPHDIFEYIASGGGDEVTLRNNKTAFDNIEIYSRVLKDVSHGSTRTNLLGESFRHPILLAPVAHQKLVHPDGEIATAQAANALEAGYITSTLATCSLEEISMELDKNKWFQLYIQDSRERTLSLVKRAEAADYSAIVITVDVPINGLRNRTQRAGFSLPDTIKTPNVVKTDSVPPVSLTTEQSVIFQGFMANAPDWSELDWLRKQTELPIIIKGITHPDDAKRIIESGFNGLVVSNHGGRTLDGLPASIRALPSIREAVGDDFLLLLDSGVRRGTDIFKAIALGANAVLIGRPQIFSLAVAGNLGVAHMLRILRDELEVTMALAGCPTIDSITQHSICNY